jgi:hypothetical protein
MILATALLATPAVITSNPGAKEPQIATSGSSAFIAYGQGDSIYFSSSTDSGKTFDRPRQIADMRHLMLGMRRGPRIAINGRTLVVTAVGKLSGDAADELYAWTSLDTGKTWKAPVRINDKVGAAREGLDGLSSGMGKFVCAWLDNRTPGTKLYSSESKDGRNWSPNKLVYKSPGGSICECCHPSVQVEALGASYMFRNSLDGNRDMYLLLAGQVQPNQLGQTSWKLDACPMDGGSFIRTSSGAFAVFRIGRMVYWSTSAHSQKLIGPGEQPVAAMTDKGPLVAFLDRRNGALRLSHPGTQASVQIAPAADDPAMGPSLGHAVLTWAVPGHGIRALNVN